MWIKAIFLQDKYNIIAKLGECSINLAILTVSEPHTHKLYILYIYII